MLYNAKRVILRGKDGTVTELGPCAVTIEPNGMAVVNIRDNNKVNIRGFPQDCNDIITPATDLTIYM